MPTLAAILGLVSTLHQPSFIIIKPSIFLSSFIYQTQQNLFPSIILSTEEESTSSERFIFIYLSTFRIRYQPSFIYQRQQFSPILLSNSAGESYMNDSSYHHFCHYEPQQTGIINNISYYSQHHYERRQFLIIKNG